MAVRVPPLQLPAAVSNDMKRAFEGISRSLLGWATTVARLVNNPILEGLSAFTVANLPTATTGALAYATNGRKVGEGAGLGTGVPAYKSADGTWRRLSDDTVVAA